MANKDIKFLEQQTDNSWIEHTVGATATESILHYDADGQVVNTAPNYIQYDITPTNVPTTEGTLSWSEDDHTQNIQTDKAGVVIQVGQEMIKRVTNKTGVAIANGKVVYIDGAQGSRPTIALASNYVEGNAERVIGVATADIADNETSYVTILGTVRDLNTLAFNEGDELWLGEAGDFTNVEPSADRCIVKIGIVSRVHGTQGTIELHVDSCQFSTIMKKIGYITKDPTGFENNSSIDISYNSTNRTITLSGTLVFWHNGVRQALINPWTSDPHTATAGKWFLYYNGTAFTWSQTPWTFDTVQIAEVLYESPAGNSFAIRETHGLNTPWTVHANEHRNVGTYRVSGGGLTTATYAVQPATPTDADNTPGFESTVIADEDLNTTISAWLQGTYTHMWVGASNVTTYDKTKTLLLQTGTTYPLINNVATGAMTETVTGRYLNVYRLMVPVTSDSGSQAYRTLIIQPQTAHTSLAAAQAESFQAISLGDFASLAQECIPYERITFRTSTTYSSATGRCRIEAVSYVTGNRSSLVTVAGYNPTSHATLLDRDNTDSHPANAISFTPSGNLIATDVQTVIYELDNEKVQVNGDLGTPSTGTLTNCTGLPVGGISATGTPTSGNYLRGDGSWATAGGTSTVDFGTLPRQLNIIGSSPVPQIQSVANPTYVMPSNCKFLGTATSYANGTINAVNDHNLDVKLNLLTMVSGGIGGDVYCMALSGTTLYVGGDFTSINGQTRNRIAAISTVDGSLLDWYPPSGVNSSLMSIVLDGNNMYLGGWFTTINGQTRNYIGSINVSAQTVGTWYPSGGAQASVYSMALSGTTLYVGGGYTSIGGVARTRIAALSTVDASVLSWYPTSGANSNVRALAVSGNTLFCGGQFTNIANTARIFCASLNTDTAAINSFYPNIDDYVFALGVYGGYLYIGGSFLTINGGANYRYGIGSLVPSGTQGALQNWYPSGGVVAGNYVYGILPTADKVYACGNFPTIGGVYRNRIGSVSTQNIANTPVQPWFVKQDGVGDAVFNVTCKVCDTSGFATSGATVTSAVVSTVHGVDEVFSATLPNIAPLGSVTSGKMLQIFIERDYTNASDTSTNSVALISAEVTQP